MTEEIYDTSWFQLIESDSSPKTGIKISKNIIEHYEAQSTFRFTETVNSKEVDLSNLVVSHGTLDEQDPDNSTYKEYPLTPTFEKDTLNYEIELMEYIDDMDITATLADEKCTLRMKVPKRDENNKLLYETDGITILYEEKEMESDVPINVTLNKLGEPDTILTVTVTSKDGKSEKAYEVTIKRPYATVKGKAILGNFDDEEVVQNILDIYGIEINNQVSINLYGANLADWESITDIYNLEYDDPFTYDKLAEIPIQNTQESKLDGIFEIYIIPGEYDIQVTRLSYLDYIYIGVIANEGDIIDMGEFRMLGGDANRDGVISQEDVNETKKVMDMEKEDPDYKDSYNPSQTGVVIAEDLGYVKQNQDQELQRVKFSP